MSSGRGARRSAPRITRPSAPAPSARSAAPKSGTSTSTEIPSPSAIAWLSRRAVTGADARRCIPRDRRRARAGRPMSYARPT